MSLPSSAHKRIYVWDLPTRLFHWSLFVCVTGAYICVKLGGLWMDWHVRFGLATLVLLAFRLIWGVTGPRYARFRQFVRGPRAILAYLRGRWQQTVGHNPLGALAIMALLGVLTLQVLTGLFADDDIMTQGPLAYLDSHWSRYMTAIHVAMEWVIITLIALHIITNILYSILGDKNLVKGMLHGYQNAADAATPPTQDTWKQRLFAVLLLLALAAFAYWLTTLAPVGDFSFM